jgi:hypothetical protein
MSDRLAIRDTAREGWYWSPDHNQPVYLIWHEEHWIARFVDIAGSRDEDLTMELHKVLVPLSWTDEQHTVSEADE